MALSSYLKLNENCIVVWKYVLTNVAPEVVTTWGYAAKPDHNNGRCFDFMVTISGMPREMQIKLGDRLAKWFIDHAEKVGLNWLIWNGRIYRHQNTNKGHGWADYVPPTGGSEHRDHVHVELSGESVTLPGPVVKPVYLPTFVVTVPKVYAVNPDGNKYIRRDRGYRITTAVLETDGYTITEAGYWYPTSMLETSSETSPK